jgi:exonuclease VII small subunit
VLKKVWLLTGNEAATRRPKKKMSYETMEALLVQKIANLRQSEAVLAQSLHLLANGAQVINLHAAHQRVHAQVQDVEHLLSAMETASTPRPEAMVALLPTDATSQASASARM